VNANNAPAPVEYRWQADMVFALPLNVNAETFFRALTELLASTADVWDARVAGTSHYALVGQDDDDE
jgi:hypothetical protein